MTAERRPTADRKREIAEAALAVIAREGLGKFTASSLAAQVGLTNGALFRHFSTMEQIVLASVDRAEEILFESFPPGNEDPVDRLGEFFCQRLRAIRNHPGVMRIVYSDELAQAAGVEGARRVREFKRKSMQFVRDCLEEASRSGMLAAGTQPKELTVIVLGSMMALSSDLGPMGSKPEDVWKVLERMLRRSRARRETPHSG